MLETRIKNQDRRGISGERSHARIFAVIIAMAGLCTPLSGQDAAAPVGQSATAYQKPASADGMLAGQRAAFVENKGQWDSRARFLLRAWGMNAWVTDQGVVYDLYRTVSTPDQTGSRRSGAAARASYEHHGSTASGDMRRLGHVVRMTFIGRGGAAPNVRGTGRQEGIDNYLIGNDPSRWATDVGRYSGARIDNLYPGIDAVFYLDAERPRYDLVVAPTGDPAIVRMRIDGADAIDVTSSGALRIATTMGALEQRELFAYQLIDNKKRQVPCAFVKNVDGTVGFQVGAYDRSIPLVIDPLIYATFLGRSTTDDGYGITIDASGNAFVVGRTNSETFPTSAGAYNRTHGGDYDAFVTKLSANGGSVTYSTFLGGRDEDVAHAVAVDGSGNAYVTGYTLSSNFPVTSGAYDRTHNAKLDVFVTKLSSSGGSLGYSTFIGGAEDDWANGIVLDGSNNAYVTGGTFWAVLLPQFPTTSSAYDKVHNGDADVFVCKVSSTGGSLGFSTFLGGSDGEEGNDIALDGNGNVYVAGGTLSDAFPTTSSAYDTDLMAGREAFITKLNASGSSLSFSTFLGGIGDDVATGIVVDGSNRVYVCGTTSYASLPGTTFPTTAGAFDRTHNGDDDVFVTSLSATGSSIGFSTLIGGSGYDYCYGLKRDSRGVVHLCGTTESTDFPMIQVGYDRSHNGAADAFVTSLSSDGSRLSYTTFLGGSGGDVALDIAIDGSGNAFVAGSTASSAFPATTFSYDRTHNGGWDAFVAKLSVIDLVAPVPDVSQLPTVTGECSARIPAPPTATDNWAGTVTGTTRNATNYNIQGTFIVTWTFDDGNGNVTTQTQTVIVDDKTPPVPDRSTLPSFSGECSATITTPPPTATDNCAGQIVGTTNDPLTFDRQGTFVVTWRFDDRNGNVATQQQTVVVSDATAPVANVPSLPTITGECSATITSPPTATDNCAGSIVGMTSDPLTYYRQGTYVVTWRFDDGRGNVTTQLQNVEVRDNTPPTINVAVRPSVLTPITGAMVTVTATPTVQDNCDGWSYVLTSIRSSEPESGLGDDDVPDDIQNEAIGTADVTFDLRAECVGASEGRVYTITYTATDVGGSRVAGRAEVRVPDCLSGVADWFVEFRGLGLRSVPNPLRDEARIEFTLARPAQTRVSVRDARGALVEELLNVWVAPGTQSVVWPARDREGKPLPAGAYFVTVEADGVAETSSMMLVR